MVQVPGPAGADGADGTCPPCDTVISQEVFNGHYGGGTPTQTPVGTAALAFDLDPPNATWNWNPDTFAWV